MDLRKTIYWVLDTEDKLQKEMFIRGLQMEPDMRKEVVKMVARIMIACEDLVDEISPPEGELPSAKVLDLFNKSLIHRASAGPTENLSSQIPSS